MKNSAIDNLRVADSARIVAVEQTRKAKEASDSAARLYNIAVSNALALKAKNRYEDKTMNLRLAWSAWLINKQYGITENAPALYEAMVTAMQENGFDNSLKVNDADVADFFVDSQNRLFTVTEWGEVAGYKIAGDKPQEFMRIKPSESDAPVHKTFFIGNNYLLYSTLDKKNYLTTISSQSTVPLGDNGYINAVVMSDDKSKIVAAYDDGRIMVMDAQSPDKKVVSSINLKRKIIDIVPTSAPNEYYVLLHSGTLLKCNLDNDNTDEIFRRTWMDVGSKLVDIRDKHLLAVCYADGYIYYHDTADDTQNYEFEDSHAKVEYAVYDPNTQILALSSSDKRITLLDT
ncbi:MAG: WD40 repeat domain-containing protein, partial [Bacteroidales bacterium]|nr:WD40 repeat domain-containing protein [Bacteroidales bacterium]